VASANISYAVYYGMMLLIPIVVGSRFGTRAGWGLKIACLSAFLVTLLATAMNVRPIVEVPHPVIFGLKVVGAAVLVNLVGVAMYFGGRQKNRAAA
jgi:threonine/homoserine/homoserine lactone efflux protein